MTFQRTASSLLLPLLLAACAAPPGGDWPQWRGPGGQGIATGEKLPVRWSADSPNVRWRAEISGLGNSSPVVSDGRVYLTTAYPRKDRPEEQWRTVLGIDSATGEVLWKTELFSSIAEPRHWHNTLAAPTPAADGKEVYVYFGSHVARLDSAGAVVWLDEVDPDYARLSRYGAASSPVLTDETVIVVQDREWGETEDVGWMAAFDRETGAERWRREWVDSCCSYSSPLIIERGGSEELWFAHSGRIASYDPATGEELWNQSVPIWQMVSTPVLFGDMVWVTGGAHNIRGGVALRLVGSGRDTQIEELWRDTRFAPHSSSPVYHDGLLFTVTDNGILTCFDAATGDVLWNHRLDKRQNRAALLLGDGKLYVGSGSGWMTVVAAAREPQVLAENTLDEPGSNASPAFGDGCLLLRGREQLFCIEAEEESSSPVGET